MFKKLIVGPNGCGKSLFAEALIKAHFEQFGYFATLPQSSNFKEKIYQHQIRRDTNWQLIEAKFDIELDMRLLEEMLQASPVVLIDGFTVYLQQLFFNPHRVGQYNIGHFFACLAEVEKLLSRPDNNWVFVDCVLDDSEINRPLKALSDMVRDGVSRHVPCQSDFIWENFYG